MQKRQTNLGLLSIKKTVQQQVGKRIRGRRKELGLDQQELAEAINRSPQQMSNIEHGRSDLTLSNLIVIARTLDKPLSFFVTGEETALSLAGQISYRVNNGEVLLKFPSVVMQEIVGYLQQQSSWAQISEGNTTLSQSNDEMVLK
jgi:transcriptional regulator with XRE-family HTH domain